MPGTTESAAQRTGERGIEIGVIHDRERVLGTHFELHAGEIGDRGLRDAALTDFADLPA